MNDIYIAHVKPDTEKEQSVTDHISAVSKISSEITPIKGILKLAMLAGLYHDAGKFSPAFQEYMDKIKKNSGEVHRGEVNHATAGGLLVSELTKSTRLVEAMSVIIYSHHGLQDCVNLETGRHMLEKRQSQEYQNSKKIDLEIVRERFYGRYDKEKIEAIVNEASREIDEAVIKPILKFEKKHTGKQFGSRDFFLGMYIRLLLSVLIDSDRIDTAEFMQDRKIYDLQGVRNREAVWSGCITFYEEYIRKFKGRSRLDRYRGEISGLCAEAGKQPNRLYRLTVPTGAGKTLSSLRFALYHAKEYQKQHIYYVASFTSILEQNAEEIRAAVGRRDIVLEHHCNVIQESEEEKARYRDLTENWLEPPIIVTTAVQMLNTLFDGKTGSVRRMHSLCNSVIIFDEVQALPVKTVELFNLAVNFLTEFCNTTVVLCSATQPVFDELPENRLMKPEEMTGNPEKYEQAFKRTTLIDKTQIKQAGLCVEELGEFVTARFYEEKQILIVVNTKSCAEKLYRYLEEQNVTGNLFHLSTNMHVLNRQEELGKMKKLLEKREEIIPLICVSTPLIEAGVDISFQCVIRSLAGLDHIIQAAGRCNRHAQRENGNVYIVKMNEKAENLSSLPDIRKEQEAMEKTAYYQMQNAAAYDLASEWMKTQYYRHYLSSQKGKTNYPVPEVSAGANLVNLLSGNKIAGERLYRFYGGNSYQKCLLKHSFQTAGELFEVIPEDGKFQVVVEQDGYTSWRIDELESGNCTFERRRELLRELQLVTVGISQGTKNEIGNGIYAAYDNQLFVLRENYYDSKTGVLKEPKRMKMLFT